MKYWQILITFLFVSIAWAGDDVKSVAKSAATQAEAEVVARLVEVPGQFPANDLYNYVYIFKYKVIKVVSGKVEGSEILVGQYNPRLARAAVKDKMDAQVDGDVAAFEAGSIHTLKLVSLKKVWKDAVEDEYFDDQSPRWFALSTNKK